MNGKLLFKYKVSYSYWALKPCVMKVTLTPTSQSSSEDRHLKIHHMIFLRISKTVNILGCTYYNILHTTKLESSSFSSNYQNWWRQISVNSMLIIHDDIKCEGENIYHNLNLISKAFTLRTLGKEWRERWCNDNASSPGRDDLQH